MQWSLSSVINVDKLKCPAVGSPFCPRMHVCGFNGNSVCRAEEGIWLCVYAFELLYIQGEREIYSPEL